MTTFFQAPFSPTDRLTTKTFQYLLLLLLPLLLLHHNNVFSLLFCSSSGCLTKSWVIFPNQNQATKSQNTYATRSWVSWWVGWFYNWSIIMSLAHSSWKWARKQKYASQIILLKMQKKKKRNISNFYFVCAVVKYILILSKIPSFETTVACLFCNL